jgi:Asp-tRNA(Asn)/Glu-tRNA(Gln) amidotransferase A subunit family amidase
MHYVAKKMGTHDTSGSLLYKNEISATSSNITRLLENAGAVFIGKTNTPEFGHSSETNCPIVGLSRNPHNPYRSLGGSSGGAAGAIAAGIGHLAIATDGAGSIRIPASFTGTVGLKPTNRLEIDSQRIGSHFTSCGFITRDVDDLGAALNILLPDAPLFSQLGDYSVLKQSKIAYLPTFPYTNVVEPVTMAVERRIKNLQTDFDFVERVDDLGWSEDTAPIADITWRSALKLLESNKRVARNIDQLSESLQRILRSPVSREAVEVCLCLLLVYYLCAFKLILFSI